MPTISIYLNQENYLQVLNFAKQEKVKIGAVVSVALEEYIKNRKMLDQQLNKEGDSNG